MGDHVVHVAGDPGALLLGGDLLLGDEGGPTAVTGPHPGAHVSGPLVQERRNATSDREEHEDQAMQRVQHIGVEQARDREVADDRWIEHPGSASDAGDDERADEGRGEARSTARPASP